ncbi:putative HD/PDEase domain [Paratrimastix pyriformis]|uniref:5'-deoxynucleotidase n=1 Tax=Paratrimastix pyriformis TaxID=342808 RepID=A0ABQ8UE25_9EUKA|nr:putative HD/PDEase domain [Paratrimastix pyriformis]
MNPESLRQFFAIATRLKTLPRTGWVHNHIQNPEAVSSHCWRTALMAMILCPSGVNKDHCVKMGLIHDLAESVIGDLTPSQIPDPAAKSQAEQKAFAEMCSLLPKENGDELLNLFVEYETAATPESKFVHELDKLEMCCQASEYEDAQHRRLDTFYNSTIASGVITSPDGSALMQHLLERRGPSAPAQDPAL